ncbi:ArsR family transcriptional regulator [Salipaludibacillus keqinensis]|jgi:DeoR family transcriptional regulator, suf operon transcriptional repressor|uniref:ArsR family transcriptional regulator n=1 Tax=Salipaludibacillus keqinensis TaxID=2045207 RepID=A0A323TH61_9BACI|nr:metalloregulator ArsR/SmtB family transcription factor [Salipaludibacillus keqinensis]PYZ92917.1 ArsR family transcriptional regulator [Salipaludibacillus keqinensis]
MTTKTTSTRDQILSLLKKKKQMTVSSMAKELAITEMAVRRHLNTLERDHIVETSLLRQAMGRPTNVYQLSAEGQELFPRNYRDLTIELLRNIQEIEGLEKVQELFDQRKEKMRLRYEKRMFLKDFDSRVHELQTIQNEQGYMVEVEKNEDGTYTFKEYNCPIAEVAKEFPVVCKAEMELFKDLLKTAHVDCQTCMATGQEGHCCYKIKQSETM